MKLRKSPQTAISNHWHQFSSIPGFSQESQSSCDDVAVLKRQIETLNACFHSCNTILRKLRMSPEKSRSIWSRFKLQVILESFADLKKSETALMSWEYLEIELHLKCFIRLKIHYHCSQGPLFDFTFHCKASSLCSLRFKWKADKSGSQLNLIGCRKHSVS